jgi:hypothetical protein
MMVHFITDTNGGLLSAVVHAANEHDSQIGFDVMNTPYLPVSQ